MSRICALFAATLVSLTSFIAHADDQQLSSDMLFCSLMSEFAIGISASGPVQEFWKQKQTLYRSAATYLTSQNLIISLLPEAREKRRELLTGAGSNDEIIKRTAEALRTCEAKLAANRETIATKLEGLRAGLGPLPASTPISIAVPEQGWRISFIAPKLTGTETIRQGRYDYRATAGRFMLSFFVESPEFYPDCAKGFSHEDNFRCFEKIALPKITESQYFEKPSLAVTKHSEFIKVSYTVNFPDRAAPIRHQSTHYLFAFNGKWIDLHISIIAPTPDDTAVLELFERSLKYEKDS